MRKAKRLAVEEKAVIEAEPAIDSPEDLFERGRSALLAKEYGLSLRIFDLALQRYPNSRDFLEQKAIALTRLCLLSEAKQILKIVLENNKDCYKAISNYARILLFSGEFEESWDLFRRASELVPDNEAVLFNLSLVALMRGDYKIGFELYEHRWSCFLEDKRIDMGDIPYWHGQPIHNKKIIILVDQNNGDIIQMMRFVYLLVEFGAEVYYLVPRRLQGIMSPVKGLHILDQLFSNEKFDYYCYTMSLPLAFGVRVFNIPPPGNCIRAPKELVQKWDSRLGNVGRELRVAIAWQGSPTNDRDQFRSIPLEEFLPLSTVAGIRLISVQTHFGVDQLERRSADLRVDAFHEEIQSGHDSFAEIAALIECSDVVVCPDTSIAHLAGALGKPVFLALNFASEWRWLTEGMTSPWYPSMSIYRQPSLGDWGGVFCRIAADLSAISRFKSGSNDRFKSKIESHF